MSSNRKVLGELDPNSNGTTFPMDFLASKPRPEAILKQQAKKRASTGIDAQHHDSSDPPDPINWSLPRGAAPQRMSSAKSEDTSSRRAGRKASGRPDEGGRRKKQDVAVSEKTEPQQEKMVKGREAPKARESGAWMAEPSGPSYLDTAPAVNTSQLGLPPAPMLPTSLRAFFREWRADITAVVELYSRRRRKTKPLNGIQSTPAVSAKDDSFHVVAGRSPCQPCFARKIPCHGPIPLCDECGIHGAGGGRCETTLIWGVNTFRRT